MPKNKECTKLVPRIYKKNAENIGLFFSVGVLRQAVPTITIEQAIWAFFKFADIDDWDMECAKVTYQQMQKDYYLDCRDKA